MSVVKHSFVYLGSSIVNKAIPFLLLPILTKYLSPSEYGTLAIFQLMIAFYTAFIGMGSHMNVSKNFHKYSQTHIAKLIGSILFIVSVSTVILLIITFVVTSFISNVFSIPSSWLQVIPFISFMCMVNVVNLTVLRNEGRPYLFGVFEIANTVINISVTLVLLLNFHYGWYSQAVGIIAASFVIFVISLRWMKRRNYVLFDLDKKEIKSILKVSLPLIPHVLSSVILTLSDRLFIERMVGLETVGVYSIGYMLGMIVLLFSTSFIKAWSPWFYKSLVTATDENKRNIVRYTYIYITGLMLLGVCVSFVGSYLLPYFVGERFYGASEYILWVSLGYVAFGAYQIFFPYLIHMNKTLFLAFNTSFAAILNIFFNYILIGSFGAIGAAYATFIAYLIMFFFTALYANKIYPMKWLCLRN